MELQKHDEWVDAVGHIQSLFNDGYIPPINASDFDDIWFSRHNCPMTQVYVNHAPELNEKELNTLLMT